MGLQGATERERRSSHLLPAHLNPALPVSRPTALPRDDSSRPTASQCGDGQPAGPCKPSGLQRTHLFLKPRPLGIGLLLGQSALGAPQWPENTAILSWTRDLGAL